MSPILYWIYGISSLCIDYFTLLQAAAGFSSFQETHWWSVFVVWSSSTFPQCSYLLIISLLCLIFQQRNPLIRFLAARVSNFDCSWKHHESTFASDDSMKIKAMKCSPWWITYQSFTYWNDLAPRAAWKVNQKKNNSRIWKRNIFVSRAKVKERRNDWISHDVVSGYVFNPSASISNMMPHHVRLKSKKTKIRKVHF